MKIGSIVRAYEGMGIVTELVGYNGFGWVLRVKIITPDGMTEIVRLEGYLEVICEGR